MSADAAPAGRLARLSTGIADLAAQRHALRIALGVALSFALGEGLDWDLTFLAPFLAAQFLVKSHTPPTLRQALVLVIVFAVASGGMAVLSNALIASPMALILALTLILYLSFYAHARGAPEIVTLMVQLAAVSVPVLSMVSPALGASFAGLLTKGAVAALLAIYVAFAVFPKPAQTETAAGAAPPVLRLEPGVAARVALRAVLILLPILLWYLLDVRQLAVVMLVTMVMMLRQVDERLRGRMAAGLLVANLIGGVVASLAFFIVDAIDIFSMFVLILLAVSLGFAGEIVRGGQRAGALAVAFGTFILLLGIGVTPMPGGSGEAFASRIAHVLMAVGYTLGAMSLFPTLELIRERAKQA